MAAARRVAESLERDKTSSLATKQDLQHYEQLMTARFESLESRTALVFQNLESRLVVKLGALMTVLMGSAAAAVSLLAR
jgi:hypothetical protein